MNCTWERYNLSFCVVYYRPLGYERVHLPLYKVTDTPFLIQGGGGGDIMLSILEKNDIMNALFWRGSKCVSSLYSELFNSPTF